MKRVLLKAFMIAIPVAALAVAGQMQWHSSQAQEQARLEKPVSSPSGVGALGVIEPRSRIIAVVPDNVESSRIEALMVKEGDAVFQGDVIAVFSDHARRLAALDSSESELKVLEAQMSAAKAELDDAERNLKRKKALLESSAVSVTAFDDASLRLLKAQASYGEYEAQGKQIEAMLTLRREELKQSTLLAPLDGTVIKVNARPGERAGSEGVIEMADLSEMDVVAEVYENDIAHLKVGQKATIMLGGDSRTYEAEVREIGYLVRKNNYNDTDPLADRDTRTVEVRLTLLGDAKSDLKHQLHRQVQVRIEP